MGVENIYSEIHRHIHLKKYAQWMKPPRGAPGNGTNVEKKFTFLIILNQTCSENSTNI